MAQGHYLKWRLDLPLAFSLVQAASLTQRKITHVRTHSLWIAALVSSSGSMVAEAPGGAGYV